MSVDVGNEVKVTTGAVVSELKDIAEKPTKEGIATNFVGYLVSIPLSFAYDFLYNLVAKKFITNQIASDIIKVITPVGVGAVFQFGKLPAGNIVAGVGYGIGIVSLIRVIISRVKGLKTAKTTTATGEGIIPKITSLWGVE